METQTGIVADCLPGRQDPVGAGPGQGKVGGSSKLRIGADTLRGYERRAFVESWETYLPPDNGTLSGTVEHHSNDNGLRHSYPEQVAASVPDRNVRKSLPHNGFSTVPDRTGRIASGDSAGRPAPWRGKEFETP